MSESARARARRLAQEHLGRGDAVGWFEALYATADGDPSHVQWADLTANPHVARWAEGRSLRGESESALVVGCGLGDDAEYLAQLGFSVTAFDVSPTAIEWCRRRFPASTVRYEVADLFAPPSHWRVAFDFVLEAYTLQVLPPDLRSRGQEHIAGFCRPGGRLLVVARGREQEDDQGQMPWPLTRAELDRFQRLGLTEIQVADFWDEEEPPVRRFVVEYLA